MQHRKSHGISIGIDRWTLRLFVTFGALTLLTFMLAGMSGCNTGIGIYRDVMGAIDGMAGTAENEGMTPRQSRYQRGN